MTDPKKQIEKGRKYLLILIILGLVFPIDLMIFLAYRSRHDYLNAPSFFSVWEVWLFLSIIAFVMFLAGIGVTRAMYAGKIWAHNLWLISGVFIGIFLIIASLYSFRNLWPATLAGFYLIVIRFLSVAQKDVKAYLNAVRQDKISGLIDSIGKTD